jgi:copper chaperone NosL
MNRSSRILQAVAALLLAPVFLLPLWSISMTAPQYHEGLGMYIGLRDIWGHAPHDIQNINILNHYIGMMPIEPDRVEILSIMPWAVGILLVTGLLVAAVGKRALLAGWLAAFAVMGTAGLYEFYRWQHMYGHNLDPMAPIKVPGMTYQPPFIGSKTLLNITAFSFPTWGTLFIALSFGAGVVALFWGRWHSIGRRVAAVRQRRLVPATSAAVALMIALVATGCAGEEARAGAIQDDRPRFAGAGERDSFCDGKIPAARFGGEITLQSGDTMRFMSVECLAGYVAARKGDTADIATVHVVDYNSADRMIDARKARFVRTQFTRTPNGLGLVATETEKVAENLHYFMGGERMTWEQAVAFVGSTWEK